MHWRIALYTNKKSCYFALKNCGIYNINNKESFFDFRGSFAGVPFTPQGTNVLARLEVMLRNIKGKSTTFRDFIQFVLFVLFVQCIVSANLVKLLLLRLVEQKQNISL